MVGRGTAILACIDKKRQKHNNGLHHFHRRVSLCFLGPRNESLRERLFRTTTCCTLNARCLETLQSSRGTTARKSFYQIHRNSTSAFSIHFDGQNDSSDKIVLRNQRFTQLDGRW